jgi:hypothetical protein
MECHLKFELVEWAISLKPNKHLRKFQVNKFEMYEKKRTRREESPKHKTARGQSAPSSSSSSNCPESGFGCA